MEKVPKNLCNSPLSQYLEEKGYELVSRGKVRDTWRLSPKALLVVASDRISIFDFVLNAEIPRKGEVLTALTHFWLTEVLDGYDNHMLQYNSQGYNMAYELRKTSIPELPIERCLVVEDLSGKMYPFEMIFRHHIGGSVFKKYQSTGMAGGHVLPAGLPKWSKLEEPIFTPSTKEEVGHDINIDADYFFEQMSILEKGDEAKKVVELLTEAYKKAYAFALERGILILDTKLEVAGTTFADEIFTPDSSRFTAKRDWEEAMKVGRDPYFQDKQPIRDWGATVPTPFEDEQGNPIVGINNLDPKKPEHVEFVHKITVPDDVIKAASRRYVSIFEMITGWNLENYQQKRLGA